MAIQTTLGMGNTTAVGSTPQGNPQQKKPVGTQGYANLNTYLQHNVGAGNQIGQQLQQGVQSGINKAQGQAQAGVNSSSGAVMGGQQKIQTGQGYASQINNVGPISVNDTQTGTGQGALGTQGVEATGYKEDTNNAITQLANDPNKLADVTGFRTGATQNAIQTSMDQANNAAMQQLAQYGQLQHSNQQQLASEGGRQGLLAQFLGKGKYGQGSSALDQAFLQQQNPQVLAALQQNLKSAGKDVSNLQDKLMGNSYEANNINTLGSKLSGDITQGLQKQSQSLTDILTDRSNKMDVARTAEAKKINDDWTTFQNGGEITPELAAVLGIEGGEATMGLEKGKIADIFKGYTDLQKMTGGAGNATTKNDVDYSKALAALSGGNQMYNNISDVKGVVSSDFGKQRSDLEAALMNSLKNTNVTGLNNQNGQAGRYSYSPVAQPVANTQQQYNPSLHATSDLLRSGDAAKTYGNYLDTTLGPLNILHNTIGNGSGSVLDFGSNGAFAGNSRAAGGTATGNLYDLFQGKGLNVSSSGDRNIEEARGEATDAAKKGLQDFLDKAGYTTKAKVKGMKNFNIT